MSYSAAAAGEGRPRHARARAGRVWDRRMTLSGRGAGIIRRRGRPLQRAGGYRADARRLAAFRRPPRPAVGPILTPIETRAEAAPRLAVAFDLPPSRMPDVTHR